MPTTGRNPNSALLKIWSLPESMDADPLLAGLEKKFRIPKGNESRRTRTWFDTDDWRLYGGRFFLFLESGQWRLVSRETGEAVAECAGEKCESFRFARDFPVSRMRTLLEPLLSIRSVQPLVSLESFTVDYPILNKRGKTVCRLRVDEHDARETGFRFRSVTLRGLRGYGGDFKEICTFLAAHGLEEEADPDAHVERAIRATGRRVLDYSSKFSVELRPEMTARQAMILIHAQLLETMRHNRQGIVKNLDSEFLHDFRVAVRRARSGLGQMKKVLPPEVAGQVRRDFSWLGRITGPARDLDVCLLQQDQYLKRLPLELRPHLRRFFDDIAEQRAGAQRKLVRNLQSGKYRAVMERWQAYLHGRDRGGLTANSERPVPELARKIIRRMYRRVLRDGKAVNDASPDGDLHRLRIQCKKLRYTLEFFSSLFPDKEIKKAVKQLKLLQDNLGVFNDLSVQQNMLREYLAGLKPETVQDRGLAAAIGCLLVTMHRQQRGVRKEFGGIFRNFACEKNQLLYAGMFE